MSNMSSADERALLPCPFCGGAAEFKPYKRDGLTLQCTTFGCVKFDQRTLRYSIDWLRDKMTEQWNTRASLGAAQVPAHPDDEAVDRFATAMKEKLAAARAKGRGGWEGPDCSQQSLSQMLREHVEKGDPRDVANFCMFLHQRGEAIAAHALALWVSPEQAAAHTDLDDPKAGRYLPCRRTPAGKFTMPLYAQSASAAQVASPSDAVPALVDAIHDLLSGWRYIRSFHGDLYGVGWDRAQKKAEAAIAALSQPSQPATAAKDTA